MVHDFAALAGVTVVDLTELLPGPYATLLMRQMGASVIKVERPGGDPARVISPGMFRVLNTGKTCLEIDLKRPEGRYRMDDLLHGSDVLIEAFRPGVLARLGLAPERLLALNPRLIIVSLTGYGQSGPMRDRPGHDINYAALTGLVGISGTAQGAHAYDSGLPVADMAGSMFVLTAVLGGLLKRERTGGGEHLDVAITDSLLHWMSARIGARQSVPALDAAEFKRHLHTRPGYGLFRARCGSWLALGALETPFWKRLVKALELEAFTADVFDAFPYRCERAHEIAQVLQARFETNVLDYWLQLLQGCDVPVTAVNDIDGALADPQFAARGVVARTAGEVEVRFPIVTKGLT